ncbi:MAG: DUF1016 domain-containing protein [Candidatus Adiutrix intracellularis]|nr:DUF1016 domain-containing protein [Candidatus Adiutrix intracellularis]
MDLLLYYRRFCCLIVIGLKIGEFRPEVVGKIQFYRIVLDETIELPD